MNTLIHAPLTELSSGHRARHLPFSISLDHGGLPEEPPADRARRNQHPLRPRRRECPGSDMDKVRRLEELLVG